MNHIFASRFARTVTLTDANGSQSVRAFIEPERVETPETPTITTAGIVDGRRWRIILPPLELNGTVTLTDDGTIYRLLRHERIGNDHHIEAIARREESTAC